VQSWQALILGIIQGATEFLPVSSSGHLVIVPWILGWPMPSLAFDTIVHLGTLVAVVTYFADDLWRLIRDWGGHLFLRWPSSDDSRLAWLLIVGTIPAVIAGFVGEKLFERLFSAPVWVGGFLFITAALLVASERLGKRHKDVHQLTLWNAVLIGLAQAAAIAPGLSRSGATIAVGLFLGLRRPAAARFSFLLSIPIILGAGTLQLVNLASSQPENTTWPPLLIGFVAAAITGYLTIRFLLSYLRHGRLYPFAVYCALVGLFVFIFQFTQ
jgi:undecaprenyl-diphosphatase